MKNNIERHYHGKMSVFEYQTVPTQHGLTLQKVLTLDNIPCLLTSMVSHRSVARDSTYDDVNRVRIAKKVFVSPKYIIRPGSFIEIFQDGRQYTFDYSGESFVYSTHQEVLLEHSSIA